MMGSCEKTCQVRAFLTPPPKWKSNRCPPVMPGSERKPGSSVHQFKNDLFHVIHKVPAGDSPYVKAKHVQVIDKDPSRAVSMFWAAINAGDRVDSALKDMAIVMKQLDRSDEAIEAIKSFRDLCPLESQQSLDNILIELYKKSGRIEEEIQMLQDKIKDIEEGMTFDGKRTKIARSQGKRIQITIEKEYSRLLGNLAWAFLQLEDYKSAEDAYRKALSLEPDKNKMCNLAICLIHLNRKAEAKFLLHSVRASCTNRQMDESHIKSYDRASQILKDIELRSNVKPTEKEEVACGEGYTPFPLDLGSSKDYSTSPNNNGDKNDLCGSARFLQSQERLGNAFLQHQNERNANFSGSSSSRLKLRATNCGQSYENQYGNGQAEGDSHSKAYVSPGLHAGTPRIPFTQPRKCLWQSKGDRIITSQFVPEGGVGRCNRKLTFKQHKGCEDPHAMTIHNSGTEFKSACGNWRKTTLPEEHTIDGLQNAANGCCNLTSELSVNGVTTGLKQVCIASTPITADGSFTEADEKNNQAWTSTLQLTHTNLNDFSTRKKSWAEMVEEDEQLLLLDVRDDFPDENNNTNIAAGTTSKKQPQNCNQKAELSGFKDGYYTQPIHLATSGNEAAKGQRISFDEQQQNSEISANCSNSPLQKRALDFECINATYFKGDLATSNGLKFARRNRLQVFKNITPESPRY